MKPQLINKVLGLAFLAGVLAAPAAFAEETPQNCKAGMDALSKEYADTGLSMPPKPSGGTMHGVQGHTHSSAELTVMRTHFAEAQRACDEGKDHESMLHQDVVRSILRLPPQEHPASHHYTKPKE
ncbi:hypothetical protein GALL_174090 [mine drainage metagenome]|uniref:Uncharacterized protein n=1 Tax=mine drainage metagenome TaxID=410659 RepID=A0A1J5S908_9ZZZZ